MTHLQSSKNHSTTSGIDKGLRLLTLQILFIILLIINVQAQDLYLLNPQGIPRKDLMPLPEHPPSELILHVQPSVQENFEQTPILKILIRDIVVKGSTVFSDHELSRLTAPYLNRILTNEILDEIRHTLTLYYINKGYVNSGAIIPDQTIVDGKIIFEIIEGRITHIDVKGNKWFSKGYIEDRLNLDAGPPLNIDPLQKRLQRLQQDSRISHIQAELKPGVNLGDGLMNVMVEEKNPIQIQFGFDNFQTPSIGAERGFTNIAHQNLTGHGDILNLNGVTAKDYNPQMDVGYSLPITAHDTGLSLRYRRNNHNVTEGDFEDLDIKSESEIFQITLRHPFYQTLTQEFAMSFTGGNSRNRTFLLGEPYSFSPGAVDGESINTVLRFAQEWTYRTQKQVVATRSQFSLGIDAMDATIHNDGLPDGEFFSWLGQVQWAGRLDTLNTQLIFRTDLQLSNDSLLGLEQISVGGRYSVRGYRENQLVRDQALISSIEARIPLVQDKGCTEYLQLAAFFDFGEAWNKFQETPSPRNISSVGLGLRWAGFLMKTPFEIRPKFEIYWGYPLRHVDTAGGDLQDEGIHFQFVIQNFF